MLIGMCGVVLGQNTFTPKDELPVPKHRTINLQDIGPQEVFIEFLEHPKPGGKWYGEFLAAQKEEGSKLFPVTGEVRNGNRSSLDPPELIRSFSGNSFAGIPLDNHLAANNVGQIVSVVNTQMLVLGPTGIWEEAYSLDDFWEELGETDRYFDPRIIFDPVENRFIMAMMQDYDCDGSNIVFAFSASEDPTGEWHLYQFEGCPKQDDTFADFPMISITDEELFFTYNAVFQDSSWQTGFNETYIYQIDKEDGYDGEDLEWKSWDGIRYNGARLRYICPIKYATEEMDSECYFVSNRSFDIENDTIFFLKINGDLDHPELSLQVDALISPDKYGVPPNAQQPKDFLQTNDARVLDAFYYDNHIQFVSATRDFQTGLSAIYHGMIEDVEFAPALSSFLITNGTDYLAYPGIVYTGLNPDDRDAIIIATHASETRNPGYSACYYNFEHSPWTTVREGDRVIDMFKIDNPFGVDPTLERWGDYVGIQREYQGDGTIWTASVYGRPGNSNGTWIGYLSRPGVETSTTLPAVAEVDLKVFPNPTPAMVSIEVETDAAGKRMEAFLYDMNGGLVDKVFSEDLLRSTPFRFHYRPVSLQAGSYVLSLVIDGVQVGSETLIVQ